MTRKRALVVIDAQRDFCPGGVLPVKDGDEIIGPANRLIALFEKEKSPIFFTRDWHPADHRSFKSRGGLWPSHCIKNTEGAKFHPSLNVPAGAVIISKAIRRDSEAYSGFQGTKLAERLRSLEVKDLYVLGLATDYCVKDTVLDGLAEGFRVFLVSDGVRGVNLSPTDSSNAIKTMISKGARSVTSDAIIRERLRRVAVSSSS
ncbi:MAG: bifunctional nicotinamidase/pyrazinamidase [Nitrososphaerota archaeon]|nr:bifunctional nicotinamidase/pyrazinamidase [Nitrososphaerota archaeon]